MPPSYPILDTHIHLWPASSCHPLAHAWMTSPTHPLAKPHLASTYNAITSPTPAGFVYVETDRYLPSFEPEISSNADDAGAKKRQLGEWAKQPLEEIRFLQTALEEGKGLKGCVLFAPMHLSPELFMLYLDLAEETAGPDLWAKVVGFRYLLQGKGEGGVRKLVASENWIRNMLVLGKGRGGKGWSFDVGVDTNRDGDEGVEAVGEMIGEVRRREENGGHVRFILNHLCKPNLSSRTPSVRWKAALEKLAGDEHVYMKLSGAFNEFDHTPSTTGEIVATMKPYLDTIFTSFPNRIMFGSDWPVCNIGGPKGEAGNWAFWVVIVAAGLEERGLSENEKEGVWYKAGCKGYGIDL